MSHRSGHSDETYCVSSITILRAPQSRRMRTVEEKEPGNYETFSKLCACSVSSQNFNNSECSESTRTKRIRISVVKAIGDDLVLCGKLIMSAFQRVFSPSNAFTTARYEPVLLALLSVPLPSCSVFRFIPRLVIPPEGGKAKLHAGRCNITPRPAGTWCDHATPGSPCAATFQKRPRQDSNLEFPAPEADA